jgi:two-component system, chemotaxis family, sensor kinase CheA
MDREELQRQLVATFRVELEEHAAALNKGLLELEKNLSAEEKDELLKTLFRSAHSIKGSARAVELKDISTVAHKMEDVLGALKKGDLAPSSRLVDGLLRATDLLTEAMRLHLEGGGLTFGARKSVMSELDGILRGELRHKKDSREEPASDSSREKPKPAKPKSASAKGEDIPSTVKPKGNLPKSHAVSKDELEVDTPSPIKNEDAKPNSGFPRDTAGDTIRVKTEKLDALMAGMGELLVARMRMEQRLGELKSVQSVLGVWEKRWRKSRPLKRALDRKKEGNSEIAALLEFFSINENNLNSVGRNINRLSESLESDYRHLALLTDDMQDGVRRVRMVPVATLFDLFPRMIRDIGREKGKEVELVLEGAETEIDRQVLEGLKDPLTHLLRNAIDHGIETPDDRLAKGKGRKGIIRLKALQSGNHIVLEVSDDGRGINLAAVRRAAVKNNLITPADAETLGLEETIDLVFQSGLSTHVTVTDLSGRGVGMDVVREQLQKLHGQVKTHTEVDRGTAFTLILPLTLATSHVLMLSVSGETLAVPNTTVERILQFKPEEIRRMEGKPAVRIDGRALPLISMAEILELPVMESAENDNKKIGVVVLGAVEKRLAFQVDDFLGAQEVVVKNLGSQLQRVRNIAGATILGTGQVVMILNPGSIIYSAQGLRGSSLLKKVRVKKTVVKKVLVVDDSITTRTLERNILENAGYAVSQAADGLEGWEKMQEQSFDAVVFDIEMPRMNGFQLTEKVRQDNRFEHLPIVLVTSLESPEDKLKGMEAGADVYITKGTFDQQELLETIERLIG